jgi:hypothetical protein
MHDNNGGRTREGRFGPGNQYARGNPQNRRVAEFRQSLLDATDSDTVVRVGKTLSDLAVAGDVTAAKVWLEFVIGKPPQAVELSGPDGEPLGVDWERLQATLLGALGRFPEAKVAVAVALRGLAVDDTRDAEQPGDGTGPEFTDGGSGAEPGPLATGGLTLDG